MLLRALEFHARAAARHLDERTDEIVRRLDSDGFVGLYVSAMRLLERRNGATTTPYDPFIRLFVAYGLSAVRAVRHLKDVDPDLVLPLCHRTLSAAVSDYLRTPHPLPSAESLFELEELLVRVQVALTTGESGYELAGVPADVFPHLAHAVRNCAKIWQDAHVLFLLDDVSTRYLRRPNMEPLFSELLFQHPDCAFKFTSEAQTIHLVLHAPGESERARIGRDYNIFDLGAEVYERIKSRGGAEFVADILKRRAENLSDHPPIAPAAVLGDTSLEAIARKIVSTSRSDSQRKEVYHGLTALARVCVGDIGDVINLYELILQQAQNRQGVERHKFPVSSAIQSNSFQEFCSRRLYELNRRESDLKTFARTFAEASYHLLVKSDQDWKAQRTQRRRLRQYLSVYVRITKGDLSGQTARMLDLIDAGLFVFAGGSASPRTKTRDSNPAQQFKLTYRKIYGLGNYIGLAESDRFELSGDDLEEWLAHPERGKEILLRNLAPDEQNDGDVDLQESDGLGLGDDNTPVQLEMFYEEGEPTTEQEGQQRSQAESMLVASRSPVAQSLGPTEVCAHGIDTAVIGLGFELRTLESTKRLLEMIRPKHVIAVRYPEPGHSDQIHTAIAASGASYREVDFAEARVNGVHGIVGSLLVDVTGLAKAPLFHLVRAELLRSGAVWICHTKAEYHYPKDEQIAAVLAAAEHGDHYRLLQALLSTGESGPYRLSELLVSDADPSRQRMLCAFASPKQERLLTLLYEREYDRVEIVAPANDTPRSRFSRLVAEVAARNLPSAGTTQIASDDLQGVLSFLIEQYQSGYVGAGLNYDLGLTGSKMQAVACSAVAAAVKVSQCWYVGPTAFDPEKYTEGVGETCFYKVSLASLE